MRHIMIDRPARVRGAVFERTHYTDVIPRRAPRSRR